MVLSRKKLKHRLRSLLAAAGDDAAGDAGAHAEAEAQSIKERLVSTNRPRPRRSKKPPPQEAPQEGAPEVPTEETKEEPKKEEKKKQKKEKKKDKKEKKKKGEVEGAAGVELDAPVASVDSEQNLKKVYVGGIPYYSLEDDIRSFFEGCGTVTEVDCMTFPESGKFRGIAILTFKTEAAAKRALALDGADMGGFYLKIEPYKATRSEKTDFAPQMIEGYNRIYAGNLSWDITEDDLKKFFSDCKITSIRFGTDKETGDFKGYAHVDFSDSTSLAVALKLDQKVMHGRPVRIRCAVPKKDSKTTSSGNQKHNGNANSDSLQKKRRTCYECGTPGHLSSSCPNKKASEGICNEKWGPVDSSTTPSKKRRTCYECGIPGHLLSACPNKKSSDVVSNDAKSSEVVSSDTKHIDDAKAVPSITFDEKKMGDDLNVAPLKKRRKCYECGIPGHLSSACPNKKATQIVSDNEKADGNSNAGPSIICDENKTSDDLNTVPSKKKNKRRTCYECGIAGHLSSECPNKTNTEVK